MRKISVGINCYNESLNIKPMYEAILEQAEKFPEYDFEIIFQDNASTDGSREILRGIAESDPHVKVFINQANFGIERSAYSCMKNATGDAFIGIPCDFEEPPELIPDMIREWEAGNRVVLGQKTSSDERKSVYFLRTIYYNIIDLFSDYPQIHHATGFGLYDREVVDFLLSIRRDDPQHLTRHILAEYGFPVKLLEYTHRRRRSGRSKQTFMTDLAFSINSLCTTSTKPLHIILLVGFFGAGISALGLLATAICMPFFDMGVGGIVVLAIWIMMLLASVLIFGVGILGEYVAVLLRKVDRKPIVLEGEKMNDGGRLP